MAKDNDITTIRIPKTVKTELDGVANEKESYHATISRLIKENQDLKQRIQSYSHERQSFMDTINVLTNIVNEQDEKFKRLDEIMKKLEDLENGGE